MDRRGYKGEVTIECLYALWLLLMSISLIKSETCHLKIFQNFLAKSIYVLSVSPLRVSSIERVYMIEFKLVQCRFVSEQWNSVGELFCGLQQIRHRGHSLPHHVQVSTESFLKYNERNFKYFAIQSLESFNADPLVGCFLNLRILSQHF